MYIRAFRPEGASSGAAAGPRVPLPVTSTSWPRWGAGEILYLADKDLTPLPVKLGVTVETGQPRALFQAPDAFWDAAPDGQRFLFAIPVGQQVIAPFTVLVNWRAAERTP